MNQFLKNKKIYMSLVIGVLFLSGGLGYFFFIKHTEQSKQLIMPILPTPPPVPKAVKSLLNDVGKKSVLPSDETPTVATITDLSKLNQAFFLNAEKGDKILMFINARQAYLYRPSTAMIINKGTLELITDQSGTASESGATTSAQRSDPAVLRVKF